MRDTYRAHVARPRMRGTGAGRPVPAEVRAEAVKRLQEGASVADTRRWLWQEHGLIVSATALGKWRSA